MIRSNSAWVRAGLYSLTCVIAISVSGIAAASPLSFLGAPETIWWSDMVFTSTTVDYDAGTDALSITNSTAATQLELGSEFGPGFPGNHYGTGGTIGGLGGGSPFSASLSVTGVTVDGTGAVTNGGSLEVAYELPPAGTFADDIADDYGINSGSSLIEGEVVAVLLGATGAGTLDVLYSVTGGALQSLTNPDLPGVPFSTNGFGLLRIASGSPSLPADWSASFTTTSATNNVFGVPEPASLALAVLGGFAIVSRRRRTL